MRWEEGGRLEWEVGVGGWSGRLEWEVGVGGESKMGNESLMDVK